MHRKKMSQQFKSSYQRRFHSFANSKCALSFFWCTQNLEGTTKYPIRRVMWKPLTIPAGSSDVNHEELFQVSYP